MLMRLFTLGLLALANASPTGKQGLDLALKNNYNVVNCGENTNHIFDLLDELSTALLPVIQDAKSMPPSSAYITFFKDPLYRYFTSSLLANISANVPLLRPSTFSLNGGIALFCVTAPDQFQFTLNGPRDGYDECQASSMTGFLPLFTPPQPYIVLCPAFFSSKIPPRPPPNHCLSVNTVTNRFRGKGQSFWGYRTWILMSVISQYYLWTANRVRALNIDDANTLLGLAPSQSRYSSYSYVYYAASIYGQCRRFPRPYNGDRELLEVDLTTPAANASSVPGPMAVEWMATDLRIDGQAV